LPPRANAKCAVVQNCSGVILRYTSLAWHMKSSYKPSMSASEDEHYTCEALSKEGRTRDDPMHSVSWRASVQLERRSHFDFLGLPPSPRHAVEMVVDASSLAASDRDRIAEAALPARAHEGVS
jgi:hypothetical protein